MGRDVDSHGLVPEETADRSLSDDMVNPQASHPRLDDKAEQCSHRRVAIDIASPMRSWA
jgi:hypothetical protein